MWSKSKIKKEICPNLKFDNSKNNVKIKSNQVVESIFHRLKTGFQWSQLPMKQLFRCKYIRQSVYFHIQKWCKDDSWEKILQTIQCKYKHLLELSSIQLADTNTPTKRGEEAVAYQGRKKAKKNMLIFTDNQGLPLTISEPIEGNHTMLLNLSCQQNKYLPIWNPQGLELTVYS